MNILLKLIQKNPGLRNLVPPGLRNKIKKQFIMTEYNEKIFARFNPYVDSDDEWEYNANSEVTLGIIFDPTHYHRYYMSACKDLNISYKVIDIRGADWVNTVKNSGCSAFLVWPALTTAVLKEMIDERTQWIQEMGYLVYPDPMSIYLLDNKRRVKDWLTIHGYETPDTWSFYKKEDALAFVEKSKIPIVFKSIKEGVSRGVVICRQREEARALVHKCFKNGFVPKRTDHRNRQWDFCLFQEYLPNVQERRMIRIGDSYLAIDKIMVGDFHSGSGTMLWAKPERYFLDKTKEITDKGNFTSMNVDFFISEDGRILVNELHALFHGPEIEDAPEKGRYLFNEATNEWEFEAGNFYRNYCCNLRVKDVLNKLEFNFKDKKEWLEKPVFSYA